MLKKLGITLICTLALGMWSGASLATVVDGVHFNPNAPLAMKVQATNFRESSVSSPGDTLRGYGLVSSFNGQQTDQFCPDCDLNFKFKFNTKSVNGSKVVFNDGTVHFFVANKHSFDELDPSSAGIGTPWLTLHGHANPRDGYSTTGELYGDATGSVDHPQDGSSGFAYFDAVDGDAQSYFDTNEFATADGLFADLRFSSAFSFDSTCNDGGYKEHPNLCNSYPVVGSGTLLGHSPRAVPEPNALGLALMGFVLIGLGFAARRIQGRKV